MMFKLEKEMIPILKRDLPNFFGDGCYEEEFVSGVGRPDIVFAKVSNDINRLHSLANYEAIEILIKYFNKKNSIVHMDRVLSLGLSPRKKMLSIFDSLISLGFIEKSADGFVVKNQYKSLVDDFVSIEAKLSNWRDGLYQALRYKTFSDSSYLAIAEDYLCNVDQKLLKMHGIGLISVSPTNATLIIKAKKTQPKNKISHRYLTESFCNIQGIATSII